MKRQLLVLSIVISSDVAFPQVNKQPASVQDLFKVEKEITEAIHQRLAALRRGDSKAHASYFSDDCIITGDNGALAKPKQIAEALSPRIRGG
jgi:hypothetical protein